jgi:cytochrome b561
MLLIERQTKQLTPTPVRPTPARSALERAMHWLLALCAGVALVTGYIMTDTGWNGIGLIGRSDVYSLHKSMGLLVTPLCVVGRLST